MALWQTTVAPFSEHKGGVGSFLKVPRGNSVFCDPSLEPSHRDGSNEGSQHTFLLRKKKIIFETILCTLSYLSSLVVNRNKQ